MSASGQNRALVDDRFVPIAAGLSLREPDPERGNFHFVRLWHLVNLTTWPPCSQK